MLIAPDDRQTVKKAWHKPYRDWTALPGHAIFTGVSTGFAQSCRVMRKGDGHLSLPIGGPFAKGRGKRQPGRFA